MTFFGIFHIEVMEKIPPKSFIPPHPLLTHLFAQNYRHKTNNLVNLQLDKTVDCLKFT